MNERDICAAASERTDPAGRAAYLDEACAGDTAMRMRVEQLLQSDPDNTLGVPAVHTPAIGEGATRTLPPYAHDPDYAETKAPDEGESDIELKKLLSPSQEEGSLGRLDHYEVLEVVGRGGMGVVLRAHDTKLRRIVALKLLAPALAAVGTARRRFAREAQSAAAVRDEHVVKIHAVCADVAVPYLVMEFVSGITLEDRIRAEGPLPVRDVVRIGLQSARGLAAAHAQGLVHRDVKPGNILLEDGVGRVKLTDFGLARAADDASISRSGVIAGTPMYMSPEQAKGDKIDHRSDLFSLGSVLYTLGTGRPAFRAESTVAVLSRVCDDDPRPIRESNPNISKWVCAVVEKLMAKDPAERIQTAAEVVELLASYLAHLEDPDRVPPPPAVRGVRVRGRRRSRRPALALVSLVVVVTLSVVGYLAFRPTDEPTMTQAPGVNPLPGWRPTTPGELAARPTPLDGRTRSQIQAGLLAQAGGPVAPSELVAVLGDARFRLPLTGLASWNAGDWQGKYLAVPNVNAVALFDARTGQLLRTLTGHKSRVYAVAFSRDGKYLAAGNRDGDHTVIIWDLNTGDVTATLKGHVANIWSVVFSPDGNRLFSAGSDAVKVWDLKTGQVSRTLEAKGDRFWQVGLSPDGKRLACGDHPSKTARIFDTDTGELLATLPGHVTDVLAAEFSANGKLLATGSDTELLLWNAETLELVKKIDTPSGWLAFDPDGNTLLTAKHDQNGTDRNHIVTRWDLKTLEGKPLPLLSKRAGFVGYLLSRDGKTLYSMVIDGNWAVSGGETERLVRSYDAATGKELFVPKGHSGEVWAVAVSPDGRTIASGGTDGMVRLWDLAEWRAVDPQPPSRALTGHTATVYSVAFSPDGKLIASAGQNGNVRLWDVATGEAVRSLQGDASRTPSDMAFSPDGNLLAIGDEDGSVRLWDVASGEERSPLRWHNQHVNSLAFSPDNRFLASAGLHDRKVYVTDLKTMQRVQTLGSTGDQPARADVKVAFGGDGRTLVYGGWDDTVRVWDVEEKKETVLSGGPVGLDGLAVDPSGRLVATARGGIVRFWDRNAPTQSLMVGPDSFGGTARSIAFTPEGRYLGVAGSNGTVSILRTPAPLPAYEPRPPRKLPDAGELAKRASAADALKPEDLPLGTDTRFRLPKVGQNSWMAQDREGKLLAVPNGDTVALFNAKTGAWIRSLSGHGRMYAAALSPDGDHLAAGNWMGTGKPASIWVWNLGAAASTATRIEVAGRTWALAFTPDGKRLVSAGSDGLRICDAKTGEASRSLEAVADECYKIGISPDGKRVACGDRPSKMVRVFDTDTGTPVATLSGHATAVRSASYSPDGRFLATCSDTELILWDADKLELVKKLDTPGGWLAFEPGGKAILTARHEQWDGVKHVVARWDLTTFAGNPLPPLSGQRGQTSFHLSTDGKTLYSQIMNGPDHKGERNVRAYDAATGKQILSPSGHTGTIWSVAASPDGKLLASAGEDGTVRIRDLATGKTIHSMVRSGDACAVAFSPDGKTLAAHWNNASVVVFDVASGEEVRTLTESGFPAQPSRPMPFSPDGTLLAAAGSDGRVRMWDVASGQLRRTFWAGPGQALAAAFSADSKVLATGSDSGSVLLWDVASGWQVGAIPNQQGGVKQVAFHPDGRSVAVAGLWKGDIIGPESPKYTFTPTAGPNKGQPGQFASKTFEWNLEAGQQYRFILTALDEGLAPLLVLDEAGDGKQLHSASGSRRLELIVRPAKATTCKMICCAESGLGWVEPIIQRGIDAGNHMGVGYVPVYDLPNGKRTHRLPGHANVADSVAWRADGKLLVTAGDDGAVRLWNMGANPPAGRLLQNLPFGSIYQIALTPEGRYGAVATAAGDIPILRIPDLPQPYNPAAARLVPDPKELAARPAASDSLKRETIPAELLKLAGSGDPTRVPPEVVAILGDARFHLPKSGPNSWMAQDREGKFLAVPNADGVALFDARTGERIRTFTDSGRMYAVAFSPDGRFLAGANWLGGWEDPVKTSSIRIWNLKTGELTSTIASDAGWSWSLAYSPDGKQLIGSGDGGLRVWDVSTGKTLHSFPGNAVWQLGLSPDGKRAAYSDHTNRTVPVVNPETGERIGKLEQFIDVKTTAFSPDGKLLATGNDRELLLWDVENLTLVKKIDTPGGWLAFEPDGKTLLTAKHDQNEADRSHVVTRWDLSTFAGKPLPPLCHLAGWTGFHLSPDGKTIFSVVADGQDKERSIRAYDAATGKDLSQRQGHASQVLSVAFSPDGNRLVSVSEEPGIRMWDVATGKFERMLANGKSFFSVAFSTDGKQIAGGEKDGTVVVYDATNGNKLRSMDAPKSDVRCVAFSPDGSLVAGTTFSGVVHVWEAATGGLRQTLSGQRKDAWSLAFSPDGKTLASGWDEGQVRLFDVASGWEIAEFRVSVNQVRWMGFHPDGHSLGVTGIGGGSDGPLLGVWDLATRKEIRQMPVPSAGHIGGAWRPDGLLMASSGDTDGTVRLWSTDGKPQRNRVIQLFPPGTSWMHAVAMSPEGRHLATANPNGTIFILRLPDLPAPYDPGPARTMPVPRELATRPAAADALKRENIPATLIRLAGAGDPARVPSEVVAVLGDARFRLPQTGQNSWMAQDREGKLLAVPKGDVIAVFDARTGETIRTLTGHSGRVYSVAISPDGNFLAGGNWPESGKTSSVKVWNLETGEVTATFGSGLGGIWCVDFSTDGKRIFGWAQGIGVEMWDLATGKIVRTFKTGEGASAFSHLGLSPDGKRLVLNETAGTCNVWEIEGDTPPVTLSGHSSIPVFAAYSHDGKLLATGGENELLLWDAEKLELLKKIATPASWLAFEPGGKTLLTAKHDQNANPSHVVARWDLATFEGKPLPPLSNIAGWPVYQLSPDGKSLYSVLADGELRVRAYDPATGKEMFPQQGHNGQLWAVAFSPDGKRLASVAVDRSLCLWDAATGKLERALPHEKELWSVAFSPDGSRVATGDAEGSVVLYDAATGEKLRALVGPKANVRSVAFSPDGTLVAGATFAGVVNVWEVATGRLRQTFPGRESSNSWCWTVAFSPDGKCLASGWGAGVILVFDLATGWEVADLRIGIGEVRWLGFHPNGRSIGAVGNNRLPNNGANQPGKAITFGVYDLATRKEIRRIDVPSTADGHVGGAWRADGLLMASCGATDGTIRLWSTDGKPDRDQMIRLATSPSTYLHGLAISPEGRHLATADPDGTVTILRLAKAGEVFEPVTIAALADAEYVLSLGGSVKVNDQEADIRKLSDLPPGPFRLTGINLDNTQVTDKDLLRLKDCSDLKSLSLASTPVGDAGLARFKDCKLSVVNLFGTQVSDVGTGYFKDCENLTRLWLTNTKVTDSGLVHFQKCKKLQTLGLGGTQATDAGLAHFKDLKDLKGLDLVSTRVTDAGLATFKDCAQLNDLWLGGTQVSDAGLAHFKDCKALTYLHLVGTPVGDAGLAHFKECKGLTALFIEKTNVADLSLLKTFSLRELRCDFKPERDSEILRSIDTLVTINDRPLADFWLDVELKPIAALPPDQQVAAVSAKLTELNPGFDGKVEPKIAGGVVSELRVNADKVTNLGPIRIFKDLRRLDCSGTHGKQENAPLTNLSLTGMPLEQLNVLNLSYTNVGDAALAHFKDCRQLTHLSLQRIPASDNGMVHFKDCKNLLYLHLNQSSVTNVGLAHFQDCKNLEALGLPYTQVNDAGLAWLKDCTKLKELDLGSTKVTDAGMVHLENCKNLTKLWLYSTPVGDAGLARFKDCRNLTYLNVGGSAVTDAGLAHLAGMSRMTELNLSNTKVTAKGVQDLSKRLPTCKIIWAEGTIEPKK